MRGVQNKTMDVFEVVNASGKFLYNITPPCSPFVYILFKINPYKLQFFIYMYKCGLHKASTVKDLQ